MQKRYEARALILLALLLPATQLVAATLQDPGFETMEPGRIAPTGSVEGWEIQATGRDVIQPQLVVACVKDVAKTGGQCLSLSIPEETVGFEFVTVGQKVGLDPTRTYEASAWVRWPEGPDAAPAGASPTSGDPSAIVSFWARHREGKGHFAGRDDWLFDNQWHRVSFRFRATDPEQKTLIYVSLLPNQKPVDTTLLLDDFELTGISESSEVESRRGELLGDPDFAKQSPGALAPPWYFVNIGGAGISGEVGGNDDQRLLTLAMGKDTSNFESAQLWQHLTLRRGVRYEVSCRMRWDNFSPDAPAPIVNYGIYHEASRTWYGPVDQILEKAGDWRTYGFSHVPPFGGKWKLYVQLNGWGNFDNGVVVSVDDLSCKAIQSSGP